jgi:hypothetical protein
MLSDLGFRIQGSRFRVQGSGSDKVSKLGILGSGLR